MHIAQLGQGSVRVRTLRRGGSGETAEKKAGLGLPTPRDSEPLALFLCVPDATKMTGQILSINGGINTALKVKLTMNEATLRAEGWTRHDIEGFCRHISPLWMRGESGESEVGMLVAPEHANAYLHTLYGGALMTFADAAFSVGVGQALGGGYSVTAHLQTQFVSAARVGDFLVCRPEVVRRTRDLVFVRGLFTAGDRSVASADGIWKIVDLDRVTPPAV